MFGKRKDEPIKKEKNLIDDKILEVASESLKSSKISIDDIDQILKSKEVISACLLYKFIEENDLEAYQEFLNRMTTLNLKEKKLVFEYYTIFSKKNNQVKTKKRII